jgi:hypothetical protein
MSKSLHHGICCGNQRPWRCPFVVRGHNIFLFENKHVQRNSVISLVKSFKITFREACAPECSGEKMTLRQEQNHLLSAVHSRGTIEYMFFNLKFSLTDIKIKTLSCEI